jgi:BON domain
MFGMFRWRRRARRIKARALAIGGIGVGALIGGLAQYFLDPERGRARRTRFADQARAATTRPVKQLRRTAARKQEYLRGRARGTLHEVTTSPKPPADDVALADRIRGDVLGDARYRPYTINVDAVDGVVSLRGQVRRPDEIKELVAAVEKVPGVRGVENFLHLPNTAAPNVADLQRPGERSTSGSGKGQTK